MQASVQASWWSENIMIGVFIEREAGRATGLICGRYSLQMVVLS
ncbi:MAG TPA: hypothetical protein VGC22_07420 [Chitinophaga sp.]